MSLIITSRNIGEIYTRNNILQNAIIQILEKNFNFNSKERITFDTSIKRFPEGSLEHEIVDARLTYKSV